MSSNNHIFVRYKALGFVTNDVPMCVGYYRKRKEPYVITCIGRTFHVYNCDKLAIVNISDSLPEPITCIKISGQFIFAASGKLIYVFVQWKKVWKIMDAHNHNITLLLPFADHLISIDEMSFLKVWTIKDGVLFSEMDLGVEKFKVTTLIHPHEYVNKILVGSQQGTMRLINLSNNKIVYSFDGWHSPITALAQSQAINVVGIGLKDGRIILHDLKFDETLMTFQQEWGPITSISFRTDKDNIMVVGSAMGHVGVWDLEKRRLESQLNEAHDGPVLGLQCLQSEPLMLTTSTDNALKLWIFDLCNEGARLLNQRSGHSKPPTKVRFHGTSGNTILSAGLDSTLRSFSTVHDSNNKSLGRASYNKKQSKKMGLKCDTLIMPPITDFCSEIARQSDWDGLLACHDNEYMTTTWNYNRSCMGQHKFKIDKSEIDLHPAKKIISKCVTITSCGNFGLIGYSNGCVNVYNMQSGIYRGCYRDGDGQAHTRSITGVFVDEVNQYTITMALDGHLKFWSFKEKKMNHLLKLNSTPLRGILHKENNLLAVALGDFSVVMVDIETRRIVRQFEGHRNDVTDMAFARQGRWLITSCMDCCIRVFDMFSSVLVDIFQLHTPITSITVSPTDELLATTHANDLGIYLWYNRALHTDDTFSFEAQSEEAMETPDLVSMPETKCIAKSDEDNGEEEKASLEMVTDTYKSPESIDDLLTCSDLTEARWLPLISFNAIKEKNRLKPVDAPKRAPFFFKTIPSLQSSLTPNFDYSDYVDETGSAGRKGNLSEKLKGMRTELAGMLHHCSLDASHDSNDKHFEQIREYLIKLTPSLINIELLRLDIGGTQEDDGELVKFLAFLKFWVKSKRDSDLCNVIIYRSVELHYDKLFAVESNIMKDLMECLKEKSDTLRNCRDLINCLLAFQRNSTL